VSRYISQKNRRIVKQRANWLCEYCRALELYAPSPFEIDHIIPIILGGTSILENLAYACGGCNQCKAHKITVIDTNTGQEIPLFHPRKDKWNEHFKWEDEGLYLIGITLKGKLTIQTLDMNREKLLNYRKALMALGVHPPK